MCRIIILILSSDDQVAMPALSALSAPHSVFSTDGLSSMGSSGERSVISRGKFYRRRKGHDLRILKALADPAAPSDRRYEDLPRRG